MTSEDIAAQGWQEAGGRAVFKGDEFKYAVELLPILRWYEEQLAALQRPGREAQTQIQRPFRLDAQSWAVIPRSVQVKLQEGGRAYQEREAALVEALRELVVRCDFALTGSFPLPQQIAEIRLALLALISPRGLSEG